MRLRQLLLIVTCGILASAATGCARTVSFDIAVRNDTAAPVTLVLTKSGSPFEPLWAAPEDLAIGSPDSDEQHSFAVLAPGQQADVALKGKFDSSSRGYLRAYRGDLQISDMSAIGPVSPNRIDVPLRPGPNRFVVVDGDGRLAVREDFPTAGGDAVP